MEATLEAAGLVKTFGRTRALDGVDLAIAPGQVLALLGPNGAGKTTFVSCVATLLRPDGGSLHVAGNDVARDPAAVRRLVALAGQNAAVEPTMTGRENVEMVARLFGHSAASARHDAAVVLERMGLSDEAGRQVRTYSGGMRRRLDLGASLVGRPRLLLLDEPTTGLDPRSRIELWEIIRELVAGGTDVLLTTQYLDEADHLATQVAIIDRGRVVASGTPRELKRRAGRSVVEVHVRDSAALARVAAVGIGVAVDRHHLPAPPGQGPGEHTRGRRLAAAPLAHHRDLHEASSSQVASSAIAWTAGDSGAKSMGATPRRSASARLSS